MSTTYVGREHFLFTGQRAEKGGLQSGRYIAQKVFGIFVMRKAYPLDKRYYDFEQHGLDIARRADTELGDIPAWADFTNPTDSTVKTVNFAVDCKGLINIIHRLQADDTLLGMTRLSGQHFRGFLDILSRDLEQLQEQGSQG